MSSLPTEAGLSKSDIDPLYAEGPAGRYLGGGDDPISPRTLQRWRLEGTGPVFVKVGRLVRYRRSALDAWLAAREAASTSESKSAA